MRSTSASRRTNNISTASADALAANVLTNAKRGNETANMFVRLLRSIVPVNPSKAGRLIVEVTETMVAVAIATAHDVKFDLDADGVPFVSPPRLWWMRGNPDRKFDDVGKAKAYAIKQQMRAALEAALSCANQ